MKYTVKVAREDDAWVADVVGLAGAHTYARNLTSLDANVREVIALVEDLAEGAEPGLDVSYEYANVSELFVQAVEIGEERRELEERQAALYERLTEIAPKLVAAGESMRDIAAALQMSPGRVSQITSDKRVLGPGSPNLVRAKSGDRELTQSSPRGNKAKRAATAAMALHGGKSETQAAAVAAARRVAGRQTQGIRRKAT